DFVSTFAFDPDGAFAYETEFSPDKTRVIDRGIPFFIESEGADGAIAREPFKSAGKIRRVFAVEGTAEAKRLGGEPCLSE
ncbi:MAG: hypothetical protein IJK04_10900, partial [Kiritimatiellae bacterium]|nr:hypothetical protein [Kiritimatiellia bacterium]